MLCSLTSAWRFSGRRARWMSICDTGSLFVRMNRRRRFCFASCELSLSLWTTPRRPCAYCLLHFPAQAPLCLSDRSCCFHEICLFVCLYVSLHRKKGRKIFSALPSSPGNFPGIYVFKKKTVVYISLVPLGTKKICILVRPSRVLGLKLTEPPKTAIFQPGSSPLQRMRLVQCLCSPDWGPIETTIYKYQESALYAGRDSRNLGVRRDLLKDGILYVRDQARRKEGFP